MKIISIIWVMAVVFIVGLFVGLLIENLINDGYENKKELDGFWTRVRSGEEPGDWVCVNVLGMTYERGLEVCKHEVGHEIFAEMCETDVDKCFKVAEDLSLVGVDF